MIKAFYRVRIGFLIYFLITLFNSTTGKEFSSNGLSGYSSNGEWFIENYGQIVDQFNKERRDVKFSLSTKDLTVHIRNGGMSYQQYRVTRNEDEPLVISQIDIYRLDLNWLGLNVNYEVSRGEQLKEVHNYYGSRDSNPIYEVPCFTDITYENIFANTDIRWYKKGSVLEYDYILHPGAEVSSINWRIDGAQNITITESGDLAIHTPFGIIEEKKPIAFQEDKEIDVQWKIEDGIIGFEVGSYDKSKMLVIDPVVRHWATYYGGALDDGFRDLEFTPDNDLVAAGHTYSALNIATTGAHQTSVAGDEDGMLVKFDDQGNRLWATYFGGINRERTWSCSIDGSDNIYITGFSTSASGVSTSNSHQASLSGTQDAYLAKFSSSGQRIWSTYYGGTGIDWGLSVSVDDENNVYLCGRTESNNGIATTGAHQVSRSGNSDAFIAKFNSSGTRIWGTYYGGTARDYGWTMATGDSLSIYMVGRTQSTTNMASSNGYQSSYGGSEDAYLVKFDKNGNRLWATYYGSNGYDYGRSCVADEQGNVYIVGYTSSSAGMATSGSHQFSFGGTTDAFVAKFNSAGSLNWATYFGGSGDDRGHIMGMGHFGNIFISGPTTSTSSIVTTDAFQPTLSGNRDAYLAKFDESGNLIYSTYYGGPEDEYGHGIVSDRSNHIYLAGWTYSDSMIATTGSHQNVRNGMSEGYLVKIAHCGETIEETVTACFQYLSPSGKYNWTTSGQYSDTLTSSDGCDSIINVDLTINSVNTLVVQQNELLTAITVATNYQWLDCNNGYAPIAGAQSQSYTATLPGLYAVAITNNGCTDTSSCYEVLLDISIDEHSLESEIDVFPNPTKDAVTMAFGELRGEFNIRITNALGELMEEINVGDVKSHTFDISDYNTGTYIITVLSKNARYSVPVIKE